MKRLFFVALLAALPAIAQSAGEVIEERVVTIRARAPAGTPLLVCTANNATPPVILVTCSVAGVVKVTVSASISVGTSNGFVGSYSEGANIITWLVQQPVAGSFTYDFVANGTRKAGIF